MKTRFLGLTLILVYILYAFTGCNNSVTEPPEIKIIAGNSEMAYVVEKITWNGEKIEEEDRFISLMQNQTVTDLAYIKLNETMQFEFDGKAPDSLSLTDQILNQDGSVKYTEKETRTVSLQEKNGGWECTLGVNPAVHLSSNSADYEAGATIRGFRLLCVWGKNECEYVFILRSDAGWE